MVFDSGFERTSQLVILKSSGGNHIPDVELERYYLGLVTDQHELAALNTHLIGCPVCVVRSEINGAYFELMRVIAPCCFRLTHPAAWLS